MEQDEIIRMARESGWSQKDIDSLLCIVETVAEAERKACLKLVDEQIHNMTVLDSYPEQSGAIYQAIINIRARGEK